MNGAKPQLHQSQMLKLADCGEYYRLRYVEGIRGPRTPRLIVGTAVHASVADDLRAKIETQSLLPDEAIHDHTRDHLEHEWDLGEIALDNGDGSMADAKDASIDRAISLSDLHHTEVAPDISPVAVEQAGVIVLKNFPFDVALRKDIVEPNAIRDTKTAAKSPAENAAETSLQLHLYAIHEELKNGKPPERLVLDYLVHTPKGQKTYHKQSEAKPTPERKQFVLSLIERTADVIQRGAFMPNPGSWLCSRRYCEFARSGVCRFWSGKE